MSRRFHLSVPATTASAEIYENIFIQRVKSGKRVICTTEALTSLTDRQNDSYNEVVLMTDRYAD